MLKVGDENFFLSSIYFFFLYNFDSFTQPVEENKLYFFFKKEEKSLFILNLLDLSEAFFIDKIIVLKIDDGFFLDFYCQNKNFHLELYKDKIECFMDKVLIFDDNNFLIFKSLYYHLAINVLFSFKDKKEIRSKKEEIKNLIKKNDFFSFKVKTEDSIIIFLEKALELF